MNLGLNGIWKFGIQPLDDNNGSPISNIETTSKINPNIMRQ